MSLIFKRSVWYGKCLIWKRSAFIPIPKKGNAKECSNYRTIVLISHACKVKLKVAQSCPTLCDTMDCIVHWILQARTLGLKPFPSPGESSQPMDRTQVSRKVILKILQARIQWYMNWELQDVQDRFRKGRGSRDQTANTHWIIEKARECQKNIYFCFTDYVKAFGCVDHNTP